MPCKPLGFLAFAAMLMSRIEPTAKRNTPKYSKFMTGFGASKIGGGVGAGGGCCGGVGPGPGPLGAFGDQAKVTILSSLFVKVTIFVVPL